VYESREQELGPDKMREIEKFLLLNVIDSKWKDHLRAMTQLREQVGLRSYAQVDPKTEYKKEGYQNYQQLMAGVEEEITSLIFRIQVKQEDKAQLDRRWQARPTPGSQQAGGGSPGLAPGDAASQQMVREQRGREQAMRSAGRTRKPRTIKRVEPRVGRNDPCPCGSGKKYKKCCSPKFG